MVYNIIVIKYILLYYCYIIELLSYEYAEEKLQKCKMHYLEKIMTIKKMFILRHKQS